MRQAAVREHVKKKFKGKQTLQSKVHPHQPESVEREYQRVTNAYMRLLSKLGTDTMERAFEKCEKELERKARSFDLYKRISEVAALTVKLSIKDWKRMVKETVGIDLLEDYYNGDFFKRALEEWTRENVDLIKTIPHQQFDKMGEIVLEGYRNGTTTTKIVKAIQKEYGTGRSHARLIARDQISKLNSEITHKQQQDAGVQD